MKVSKRNIELVLAILGSVSFLKRNKYEGLRFAIPGAEEIVHQSGKVIALLVVPGFDPWHDPH